MIYSIYSLYLKQAHVWPFTHTFQFGVFTTDFHKYTVGEDNG